MTLTIFLKSAVTSCEMQERISLCIPPCVYLCYFYISFSEWKHALRYIECIQSPKNIVEFISDSTLNIVLALYYDDQNEFEAGGMARSRRNAGDMLGEPQDEDGQSSVWADYGTRKSRNKENESQPARCACGGGY